MLPVPPEKELGELQGRLWSVCYRDEHICVYACVKSTNSRKQLLRVELRCERVDAAGAASVSDVGLRLPAGVSAQEVDAAGLVSLAAGELRDRSAKVKANIGLAPFLTPVACPLACEVQYSLASPAGEVARVAQRLELLLPCTTCLVPAVMTEDDVAEYISQHSAELQQQTAQALTLAVPGAALESLSAKLPELVGRCAGLCHFHGIPQASAAPSQKGQKFLLVAQPPAPGQSTLQGQQALPEGARIVCLCAGLAREQALDLRVTVKSCRKDVSDDVCNQLASVFRELVEGRLRSEPSA